MKTYPVDWQSLTLRQKIGQTMIMLPNRKLELELGGGSLTTFFRRYPVSGFFMGWKLFDGVDPSQWVPHIRQSVNEYQAASELPLLFQEDYEFGLNMPGATQLPYLMSVGAANSDELAYKYGMHLAREARSVGVRWVLHPVADLQMNPQNPIANVRAIADDASRAYRLLSKQIAGLQEQGVAATIKHFPGDGVDSRDQHLCTTCNILSWDDWMQTFGTLYKKLIEEGVMAIMPGHITLPAYQQRKQEYLDGLHPPATLSKALLTDLLKGELGFGGVIVSDAMIMAGFRGWYANQMEAEIQSFLAGVDMMLWPSYEYMDEVERRIVEGSIPMERLNDAVARIWAMKQKLGLLDPEVSLTVPMSEQQQQDMQADIQQLADLSVTLVRDRKQQLPLRREKGNKVLLLAIVPQSRKGGDGGFAKLNQMKKAFEQRGFEAHLAHNLLYETNYWQTDIHEQYDHIVVLLLRAPHQPFGPLLYWDDEAQSVWGVNAIPKDKVVVVSLGSPYLVNTYFERVHACVNAYSYDSFTQEAVVRLLLGEIEPNGQSPVMI